MSFVVPSAAIQSPSEEPWARSVSLSLSRSFMPAGKAPAAGCHTDLRSCQPLSGTMPSTLIPEPFSASRNWRWIAGRLSPFRFLPAESNQLL